MWKKKLTFMFIPTTTGISRQVRVPIALIWAGVAGVLILVFSSFFLSAQFFNERVDSRELDRLRSENKQLQDQFEQMRWNLTEVESRYDDLVQKETAIRTLFNLPEINPEERQLGVGGPEVALDKMTEPQQEAVVTEQQVDRLLNLSEFELEKYGEVEDALVGLKTRLDHTPSIWPAKGWTSRGFGMKYDPFTGMKQMHRGIDIANRVGTPIMASADGRVTMVGKNGGMGKTVVIDHGYGFVTRYAHLSEYKVKRGQRVKRGDLIALMGSTGYSTGPHLHYEVLRNGKSLNPADFILNDK